MNTRLRIGKTYKSQLLYVVLLPAFFAGFCFLYNPFGMHEYYQTGGMSFGFHFLMLAVTLMAILALTRLIFSALYKHIPFLWWHYVLWCIGETFVFTLFMGMYTTLFGQPIFDLEEKEIVKLMVDNNYFEQDVDIEAWGERRISFNEGNIDFFFEELNRKMNLAIDQLMERYKIQASKKVRNYPFLMGQGVWIDSDKLKEDDTVGEVLKHGTLSVGFIGLAETLKALMGVHHGESPEAQALGLEIIGFMRKRLDDESKKTGFNYTLLATPAEGLSGRFVRIDRAKYGVIEGVTDREYYTNSFHIPV